MLSVNKKEITTKVYFLLILMFSFICRQFLNEGIRIYDLAAYESEQCLDISLEDSCSLETTSLSIDAAEECVMSNTFKPVITELTLCKEAISFTSNIHEVYLGLNTPPPEQSFLLA